MLFRPMIFWNSLIRQYALETGSNKSNGPSVAWVCKPYFPSLQTRTREFELLTRTCRIRVRGTFANIDASKTDVLPAWTYLSLQIKIVAWAPCNLLERLLHFLKSMRASMYIYVDGQRQVVVWLNKFVHFFWVGLVTRVSSCKSPLPASLTVGSTLWEYNNDALLFYFTGTNKRL